MSTGLDYAFSHPDLACVARQGHTFVARYIGDADPNPLKYLDAAELAVIRAQGLSVVVVRETTAGFMLTDKGAVHAKASRAHCDTLGLHGIPIYYALDVDPRGLTPSQRLAVSRFLQDAADADGGGQNVGIYGSDDAVDMWARTTHCHWGWQTFAWSAGRISPKAHFRQYRNGVSLCGGTVDLNETYANDFGQWPRPGEVSTPAPLEDEDDMELIINGNLAYLHIPGVDVFQIDNETLAGYRAAHKPEIVYSDADFTKATNTAKHASAQRAEMIRLLDEVNTKLDSLEVPGLPGSGPVLGTFTGDVILNPEPST